MAPLWHNLREACGGELSGNGLQHSNSILHASLRNHEHRLFQVANEQRSRLHDVPPLLRLRCRLTHVRVRDSQVSRLGGFQ